MLQSKIATAVVAVLALGCSVAYAQDAGQTDASQKDAKKLESITVTGSLIPQAQIETATPVITITADQMQKQGFSTVADALSQASFATGSVAGAQSSASFTQGAQTLSMFGLPVGFTKYLIDGRPMGNFPALYNGSDAFNNLSGIPIQMVDRIEILPGGQSSLYGSDAIAGVINIILKKKIDAPVIDVRFGGYKDSGGFSRRISLADSFSVGKFNIMGGIQYEKVNPIWGYDRDLTSQYYRGGTSAAVAGRDYLVNSSTGKGYVNPLTLTSNGCNNVAGGFHGTEGYQTRKGSGNYCGSFESPGYKTVNNGTENAQVYTHATFDATPNIQLYGDLLYNYDEQYYNSGSGYTWWGSSADIGSFYDPTAKDIITLQRGFTPEEVGGYNRINNKQIENSYMLTLGAKGTLGQSNWDYDLGFTHSDDKIITRGFARWADPIDNYFINNVMGGPSTSNFTYKGVSYPVYNVNWNAFYSPVSRQDFDSFTGYTTTHAKTWDNMLRGQLTNASLFSLPGGDAGLAVVVEGGNQGWNYSPDARLTDGEVWGTTDVQGAGHRSRYAGTVEFRAPITSMLTLDASGRYDKYKVDGGDFGKKTYNLGLEFRPFESLLIRGKYGTAFKAPTLSDEFQGQSGGYYNGEVDYYNCGRLGYTGGNVVNCPSRYSQVNLYGTLAGNPALKPITAKVWSYGFVYSPLARMSLAVDFLHWGVKNEVQPQSVDTLLKQDNLCRNGTYDINSPTCVTTENQIVRASTTPANDGTIGALQTVAVYKANVAKRTLNALNLDFRYGFGIGSWGDLNFDVNYSDTLKHKVQNYPGDPVINYLTDPTWSTDFKTRVNATVNWHLDRWSATLFANRYGSTPNYLAYTYGYDTPGAGKLRPWIRYNASVSYSVFDNLDLSLMVNNLFNKMPPADHSFPGTSGTPYNTSNYDVFGRAYYVEATYRFGK